MLEKQPRKELGGAFSWVEHDSWIDHPTNSSHEVCQRTEMYLNCVGVLWKQFT